MTERAREGVALTSSTWYTAREEGTWGIRSDSDQFRSESGSPMQPTRVQIRAEPWPVEFEGLAPSVMRCDNVVVEESLQSATEDIVVVAGDHMTGPGDVDQCGGRDQLEQLLGTFFADHMGLLAPHEHRGNVTAAAAARARS